MPTEDMVMKYFNAEKEITMSEQKHEKIIKKTVKYFMTKFSELDGAHPGEVVGMLNGVKFACIELLLQKNPAEDQEKIIDAIIDFDKKYSESCWKAIMKTVLTKN